jgi:superfamily I DNA/RNA helicase
MKTFSEQLAQLNQEQRRAVSTTEGRLLILAGAGSGKTKVLTMRMAYLVAHLHVSPRSILGLTFTNKAAGEMRHRVGQMIDRSLAKQITLSTFHGFCMQLLRREAHHLGYTSDFSLYSEREIQRLMQQILKDEFAFTQNEMPSLQAALQEFAQQRSGYEAPLKFEPDVVENDAELETPPVVRKKGKREKNQEVTEEKRVEIPKELYSKVSQYLRIYNAVDFDHLLTLTVELFENHPEVLQYYRQQYRYIMIDEYQDTNPIQDRIASLLAGEGNLCVVGDDDQSIYGWRGAQVRNILSFPADHVVKLEQNYRSTNIILQAANGVIKNNTERFEKVMWSQQLEGAMVELFHAPTPENEAEAVIHRLALQREREGKQWKDFAILYRSNAIAQYFETMLLKYTWYDKGQMQRGIPYQVFGGQEFYERREVKDLIAYLRVIANPNDQEALLRILNVPRRHLGERTLEMLTQVNRRQGASLWQLLVSIASDSTVVLFDQELSTLSKRILETITQFVDLIKKFQDQFANDPLAVAATNLINEINYKQVLEEEHSSEKAQQAKWDNLQEFISAIEQYELDAIEQNPHMPATLSHFLQTYSLDDRSFQQKEKDLNFDAVKLMTFHSAKGLEFHSCFLVSLEDHILPHLRHSSLEEERRLFYVGITRAQKRLCCSMARQRKLYGNPMETQPSRFLLEIPKELVMVTNWNI